jgi:hypothetical protein
MRSLESTHRCLGEEDIIVDTYIDQPSLTRRLGSRECPLPVLFGQGDAVVEPIVAPGVYTLSCRGGYPEVVATAISAYVRSGILPEAEVRTDRPLTG